MTTWVTTVEPCYERIYKAKTGFLAFASVTLPTRKASERVVWRKLQRYGTGSLPVLDTFCRIIP
jgi:hypothetical protein